MRPFLILARLEGLSFLTLLLIAMPLKYYAGLPQAVQFTGMAHGLLFIAYCTVAFSLALEQKWSLQQHLLAYVAAVLPFGTFWFEKKYYKA